MDILTLFCFLVVYIPWDVITFDRYSFFEEINGYITISQMKEYIHNDLRNFMYNLAEVFSCGLYTRPEKKLERFLGNATLKFKREYMIKIKIIDEEEYRLSNDDYSSVDYSSSTLTTPLLPNEK